MPPQELQRGVDERSKSLNGMQCVKPQSRHLHSQPFSGLLRLIAPPGLCFFLAIVGPLQSHPPESKGGAPTPYKRESVQGSAVVVGRLPAYWQVCLHGFQLTPTVSRGSLRLLNPGAVSRLTLPSAREIVPYFKRPNIRHYPVGRSLAREHAIWPTGAYVRTSARDSNPAGHPSLDNRTKCGFRIST